MTNDAVAGVVDETINFSIPLVQLNQDIFSLEMFHGNTLAFKDIGARFMSRCLGHFVKNNDKKVTVLVATSGDTGGAVADGFYGVEGVDVVILYPSGKVSLVQEKQLTTLGNNIHAVEVNGSFDDCQALVKQAFMDHELSKQFFLTSANSINVARWLPQQFFYFLAYKQWRDKGNPPVISVPSGNFGNICAGLIAMKSGLPVKHFIAACNANDVVPRFMKTQHYVSQKSISTISNAMDVGDPSNFIRILSLFDGDFNQLSDVLSAVSVSDEETKIAIMELYKSKNYLLDPHGAVGYLALKNYLDNHPGLKGYFAETAHPVKFFDVVEPIINNKISLPSVIESIINKEKKSTKIEVEYNQLKDYLLTLDM
jgi:threonine synthase